MKPFDVIGKSAFIKLWERVMGLTMGLGSTRSALTEYDVSGIPILMPSDHLLGVYQ